MFSLHPSYRRSDFALLLIVCLTAPAQAGPLSLEQALNQALAGNPGLAEIKSRADALASVPPQAGSLPDPFLSFGALNVPTNDFSLNQDQMTMMEVAVSQQLPFPGKLGLAERAAQQEAIGAAKDADEARLRLARDIRLSWWALFYYDRTLGILAESRDWMAKLADIADQRYRLGQAEQSDSLLARLELTKLRDKTLELINMRHGEAARLNVLLDRSSDSALELPPEAAFRFPELSSEPALLDQAQAERPLLAQKQAAIEAAQNRLDLAKKEYLPDLNLGFGYAFRQNAPNGEFRSDFANFRLSMNLPLYAATKQSKQVDQRQSELMRERYALHDAERSVQADVTTALAAYHHAHERLSLFEKELLPQARGTLDSLSASYRVGKIAFADVLRAQLSVFDYQVQYWNALTTSQQALARLAAALGKETL